MMKDIIESFDTNLVALEKKHQLEMNNEISKLKYSLIKKVDIKIGDIIYNVTGIIKVESIEFNTGVNGRGEKLPTYIAFKGRKYKWLKDGYVTKTKHNDYGTLYSYSSLKKIDTKLTKP